MSHKYNLSQALRKIKKLKGDVAKFEERTLQAITYNKETPPAFPYEESRRDWEKARENLIRISARVAETNACTNITWKDKEISIAEALRRLQELKSRLTEAKGLANMIEYKERETVIKSVRHKREDVVGRDGEFRGQRIIEIPEETTMISNITIGERAAMVEQLEADFEALNNLVERTNHETIFSVDLL